MIFHLIFHIERTLQQRLAVISYFIFLFCTLASILSIIDVEFAHSQSWITSSEAFNQAQVNITLSSNEMENHGSGRDNQNQAASMRGREKELSEQEMRMERKDADTSNRERFENSGIGTTSKPKTLGYNFIPRLRPEPLGVQIMKANKYFKLRNNPLPLCPNKFKIQATLRDGQFSQISDHASQEYTSTDIKNHNDDNRQEEDVKGFILHTTSCSFLLEPLITPPMFLTKEAQRRSIIIITIKAAISSITMLTVVFICIYYHYDLIYQAIQSKGILANSIMFRVKCYALIFLECAIMMIHIPPFLECCILPEWQVLVLIRLVQITKVLRQNCKIHQRIIGKMLGGLASLQKVSTVRVYLLTHPYSCISAFYVFCVFGLGYCALEKIMFINFTITL